jgi:hypothetical protein
LNPPIQLSLLLPLGALALAVAAFASLRSSSGRPLPTRALLAFLRLAAVAALFALLINPGKWIRPSEEKSRPWIVLHDVSASMATLAADGKSRAAHAVTHAAEIRKAMDTADLPLRIHPFSSALAAAITEGPLPEPTGIATHLLPAISQVLQDAGAAGESLAGIIVLGDGRETLEFSPAALDTMALRARSGNTAVHTVALGADTPSPDLAILQNRVNFTAFPGQALRIPFSVESSGLEPIRTKAILRDAESAEIASLDLELPPSSTTTAVFEITAPAASTRWSLEIPKHPGEVRSANNLRTFNIRLIDSKTRVFLAEGAPYWDSKFLAQLLRQQPHVELNSVHRLSDQRYFRIDSGTDEPSETDHPVFPATLDELSRYDLIVFGKNVDPFLTPERLDALRSYVRDRGGAVLFARGRPTTSDNPALEPLEPVAWTAATATDFRFMPTRDGGAAGLFGDALPAPEAALWTSLPTLKDGRMVSLVKPFTRILAEGRIEGTSGPSGRFPALLMRRYGQGVTGLVNGDGVWKWDFYPEARELGNCYEDFWTQLIQWMASYSEFLPGQDFSLRLPATRGPADTPIAASISFRGSGEPPQPLLKITNPAGVESQVQPASLPDPSGRPLWRASFTPDAPGEWTLAVVDPREKAAPTPSVVFTVPQPPAESDDLSPDPEFLERIATATGGTTLRPTDLAEFLEKHIAAETPATFESGAVWQPAWNHAAIALLIAALFSTEWLLRRRQGLA